MEFETHFDVRGYRFSLAPTPKDTCMLQDEARFYSRGHTGWWRFGDSSDGTSRLVAEVVGKWIDVEKSKPVYDAISSWTVYHFHDTSSTAGMRHSEIVQDDKELRTDASNIGPFLLKLKKNHPGDYKNILNAVRLVTPFFDDFILEPRIQGNKEEVNISWQQKGSDYPMQPYHLSDGSIRFICLATALLQPVPPSTIIIDEPELGLHPAAIVVLAELINVASKKTQVIVATQSPALIDQFGIQDIIVVNHEKGASSFKRLKEADFTEWLKNYSVGELWSKNVIPGGPVYE
jgi:predicted ATPase